MDSAEGLDYIDLDDHEWYDSGDPEMCLKSQIDHSLRREDLSFNFREWLNQKLSE